MLVCRGFMLLLSKQFKLVWAAVLQSLAGKGAAGAAVQPGEPNTPLDAGEGAGDLASPQPWSTGQSSLSAGADPAVPFSVRCVQMETILVLTWVSLRDCVYMKSCSVW